MVSGITDAGVEGRKASPVKVIWALPNVFVALEQRCSRRALFFLDVKRGGRAGPGPARSLIPVLATVRHVPVW